MNNTAVRKVFFISRMVFMLFLLFMISGAITRARILIILGALLASISWITPGLLLLVNMPWLAQSWLRGINSIWIPAEPWEQLTSFKRFVIYFYSIVFSVFVVIALITYLIQWAQKR